MDGLQHCLIPPWWYNNSRMRLTINGCLNSIDPVHECTNFLRHPLARGLHADDQLSLELGFQLDALSMQCTDEVVAVRGSLLGQLLAQLCFKLQPRFGRLHTRRFTPLCIMCTHTHTHMPI